MSVPERIGKYEVQAVLGKGAMGTVYRGFDATIQRFVALKVIAKSALEPDDLEHTLRRFRQEAQAVGRLMHPRIAAIYDFIETDELACIVMELASGKPLSQHLKEVTRYDLGQTWQIASQILGALEYCHSRGVVHRDLKPANILIDDDFRIKITDFGVARIDNSSLTQFGDLIGTPHYMAPEQCVSGQCTSLTDLYQVGVIVYELLTGEPPFVGTTAEVLRQVLQKSPPDPSQLNPSIPPSLAKVVEKALAKEPRGRYTSARTLAEALKESIESSLGVALASAPPDSAQAVSVSANLLDNARLLAAGAEDPEEGGAGSGAIFAAVADSKKARVLFVDDDERILNALRALFKAHYHVFTAENGALALEIVKRFDIHVIVSDQRMPGMAGVDLLREAKAIAPGAVRLLLTGYSDLAATVGSINEGEVFRFVRKPWDNNELRSTIDDAVAIAAELASPSESSARADAQPPGSVLVIDPEPGLAQGLIPLLSGRVRVHHCLGVEDAVGTLEKEEVAVIVSDLAAGKDELITLFELLKAEHPEILSIVVASAPDAELVIELINHAQIYRLIDKPVSARRLRSKVEAAMQKYADFKRAPELVRQHRAHESELAKPSPWRSRLLERIRALPDRFFLPTS